MSAAPKLSLSISTEQLAALNRELRHKSPLDLIRWALAQVAGRAIVSTNFRPYEAALLHLATRVQPDIPVLWVDHGYNRPATYKHAEALRTQLGLNLKPYLPQLSAAHRDAIYGPVPSLTDEAGLKTFSAQMKLEPFQRGMRELAPKLWITALRQSQNPGRAELDILSEDKTSAHSNSAHSFIGATPSSTPTSPSTAFPTSGITSTPPKPTKNANAACTRVGRSQTVLLAARTLARRQPFPTQPRRARTLLRVVRNGLPSSPIFKIYRFSPNAKAHNSPQREQRTKSPPTREQLPPRPSPVSRNRSHSHHARSRR